MTAIAQVLFKPKEVTSLSQALHVALIRNVCIGLYTHHNEAISPLQQRAWWNNRPKGLRLWLYGEPQYFAFGMLRPDDGGRLWATLGVIPSMRNQGFGTAIYRHLIEQGKHVWIEIGKGNPASYQAARKAGFMPAETLEDVMVLVGVQA